MSESEGGNRILFGINFYTEKLERFTSARSNERFVLADGISHQSLIYHLSCLPAEVY
jgi:hypothetical protein